MFLSTKVKDIPILPSTSPFIIVRNKAKEIMNKPTLQELLNKYFELKDELEEYTSEHHDNILWDIIGYREELEENPDEDEEGYYKDVEKQVKTFTAILKAYEDGTDTKVLELDIEYTFC